MIVLTRVLGVPKVDLVEVVVVEAEGEATVVEAARNATSAAKLDILLATALREVEAADMAVVEEDTRAEVVDMAVDTEEAEVVAAVVVAKLATLVAATATCRETAPKVKSATTVSLSSDLLMLHQLTVFRWRGRSSESRLPL